MKLFYSRNRWGFYMVGRSRKERNGFNLGKRKPRGLPALNPGECIPVELVPVVKGKKARKA